MLSDVIDMYIEALNKGDKKECERLEKKLYRLGMDKATLMIIVRERKKGNV